MQQKARGENEAIEYYSKCSSHTANTISRNHQKYAATEMHRQCRQQLQIICVQCAHFIAQRKIKKTHTHKLQTKLIIECLLNRSQSKILQVCLAVATLMMCVLLVSSSGTPSQVTRAMH